MFMAGFRNGDCSEVGRVLPVKEINELDFSRAGLPSLSRLGRCGRLISNSNLLVPDFVELRFWGLFLSLDKRRGGGSLSPGLVAQGRI